MTTVVASPELFPVISPSELDLDVAAKNRNDWISVDDDSNFSIYFKTEGILKFLESMVSNNPKIKTLLKLEPRSVERANE